MKRLIIFSVLVLSLSVMPDLITNTRSVLLLFEGIINHSGFQYLSSPTANQRNLGSITPNPVHAQTTSVSAKENERKTVEVPEIVAITDATNHAAIAETLLKVSPNSDPTIPLSVKQIFYSDGTTEVSLSLPPLEDVLPALDGSWMLVTRTDPENGLTLVQKMTVQDYNLWLVEQGLDPIDVEGIKLQLKALEHEGIIPPPPARSSGPRERSVMVYL